MLPILTPNLRLVAFLEREGHRAASWAVRDLFIARRTFTRGVR